MNTNQDVALRSHIPMELQGRVYSVSNSLQFFTIPISYLAGGMLVDWVLEPWMAQQRAGSLWSRLFGTGKGSGAAMLFGISVLEGPCVCLWFYRDKHI